jgi:outer membrane immunogenic protein
MFFMSYAGALDCAAAEQQADAYQWSGAYAGINVGWIRGTADAGTGATTSSAGYFAESSVAAISSAGAYRLSDDNVTAGGQVGYNRQYGRFVVGCEADFNYTGIRDAKHVTAAYPAEAWSTFTIASRVRSDWMLTVRPRLGYAFGRWLVYATGGLAVAEVKGEFRFTDTFSSLYETSAKSDLKTGWTVGAGIEAGIYKNLSVKAEYLYTDLGRVSATGIPGNMYVSAFPASAISHYIDLRSHIVRMGVNYRF